MSAPLHNHVSQGSHQRSAQEWYYRYLDWKPYSTCRVLHCHPKIIDSHNSIKCAFAHVGFTGNLDAVVATSLRNMPKLLFPSCIHLALSLLHRPIQQGFLLVHHDEPPCDQSMSSSVPLHGYLALECFLVPQ